MWPILGWGIGIAIQYAHAYGNMEMFSTEKEYEKLKKKNNDNAWFKNKKIQQHKKNINMKKIITTTLLLIISLGIFAQSEKYTEFMKKNLAMLDSAKTN